MEANAPENYPMQFKDKIDEYLWKEHHILGGCCSSIESLKYTVAREVAEKLTDAFIENAKKWFEKQNELHDINGMKHCDIEDFENFKNYMKGE